MKPIKLLAFAITIFSVALFSCDKDDDATPSTEGSNEISIGNQTFSIKSAFKKPGTLVSEGVYQHEVYFLGDGITYSNTGTLSGQGSMVYANLYSNSQDGLTGGTYAYPPFGENAGAFSIRFVTAGVNLDFNDPNGTNPDHISNGSSGSVTIEGSGSTMQMNVNVTATNANKIETIFSGELDVVE